MMRLLMMSAVVSLLVLGCGTDSTTTAAADDLTGSSWVLEAFVSDGQTVPAVDGAESTLTFVDSGDLAGSTGCNRFTGTWQQDGASVTLDTGATTLAACIDPAVDAQEQALLTLLPQTETVERSDDMLTLLDADGAAVLTYRAGLTDLAGTSWTATGINNQTGAVESSALTSTVTAEFGEDGTVSGFTGCRDYTAAWQVDADTISVTDLATEGSECTGDAAAIERAYLAALSAATIVQIEGSTLNLRDSDGATQVNYTLATS
jgi:heat shock protein HslJ